MDGVFGIDAQLDAVPIVCKNPAQHFGAGRLIEAGYDVHLALGAYFAHEQLQGGFGDHARGDITVLGLLEYLIVDEPGEEFLYKHATKITIGAAWRPTATSSME